MRLAEEVEQIGKRRRGDEAHDNGPAQKLLVPPAIGPSHPRQKVVAMFFFAFPRPKHERSLVRLGCNSQTGRIWQTGKLELACDSSAGCSVSAAITAKQTSPPASSRFRTPFHKCNPVCGEGFGPDETRATR